MGWQLFEAGEGAVLIELGRVIDDTVNDLVHRVARHIRSHGAPVLDVVPGYTTVLVVYEPCSAPPPWQELVAEALSEGDEARSGGRTITIPVLYGGDGGPDIKEVALANATDEATVVAEHADRDYRVYCLGFSPGFPFLGQVPESIQCKRKAVPRSQVPAGSVGIAERQTGIYALPTPGGWQIIGRTPLRLFRPGLRDAVPYGPSDRVRFQQIDEARYWEIAADDRLQDGAWPDALWDRGIA
ncbi:MAG: 5-oxoprolinase subunit PxpB [Acidimicrobiales bacterium]